MAIAPTSLIRIGFCGTASDDAIEDIMALPFPAPSLDGVSGKRELHNNTRKYFDVENQAAFPVVKAVSDAFQDKRVTDMISKAFGTDLSGTYLRIEFAQDTDGFWLGSHTDLASSPSPCSSTFLMKRDTKISVRTRLRHRQEACEALAVRTEPRLYLRSV